MVFATRGYVSPEAEAALAEALARDPANLPARYYRGLAEAQTGRLPEAFATWKGVIADSPPDAPWLPDIAAQMGPLAAAIGEVPPPMPGMRPPDGPDAEAIRGMVEGLAARLAAEGGPADDWARLVRSLGVLGERDRAAAILAEARQTFAADPAALAILAEAAKAGGLSE
jgi:cytochrome c-type biogenesis protein CcmH